MHQATIYVLETPCLGMAWTFSTTAWATFHIRQRPGEGNSVQHPIGGTYASDEQRVPVTEYSDGGVDGTRIDGGEDHGEA